MIYLVDLDGTIADLSHRLHFIEQKPADWDAFYAACVEDAPIESVIAVIRALQEFGHITIFVSGRSKAVREATFTWLEYVAKLKVHGLYMRNVGDHREDTVVKAELYDLLMADLKRLVPEEAVVEGVFEDRASVVKMWRDKGLKVFQVAEGDF